jgi:zinc and cadmium transporter
MIELIYIFLSVLFVSLLSIIVTIPFFLKKKISKNFLLFLLALSVGTLLGAVFIHLIPEIIHEGYNLDISFFILGGFLFMFIIEKIVHWKHKCKIESDNAIKYSHSHAYHLAPINLIGDGIHNFIDGIIIAVTYLVSIPLGIATTISIIFHEIPQEISDFGILLYSGYSRKKALIFNFLSATLAIIGGVVGIILFNSIDSFNYFIIPFTVGTFIYIACSNLVPELHRIFNIRSIVIHLLAIIIGIMIMILVSFFHFH